MSERTLQITETDPVAVFGPNDQHLRIIREHFPKLNIVARGDTVKVIGPAEVVDLFFERFEQLIQHVSKYNELPRKVLDDIMSNGDNTTSAVDAPTTSSTRFSASSLRTEPVDRGAQRVG